jgi:hypothetical protein
MLFQPWNWYHKNYSINPINLGLHSSDHLEVRFSHWSTQSVHIITKVLKFDLLPCWSVLYVIKYLTLWVTINLIKTIDFGCCSSSASHSYHHTSYIFTIIMPLFNIPGLLLDYAVIFKVLGLYFGYSLLL